MSHLTKRWFVHISSPPLSPLQTIACASVRLIHFRCLLLHIVSIFKNLQWLRHSVWLQGSPRTSGGICRHCAGPKGQSWAEQSPTSTRHHTVCSPPFWIQCQHPAHGTEICVTLFSFLRVACVCLSFPDQTVNSIEPKAPLLAFNPRSIPYDTMYTQSA